MPASCRRRPCRQRPQISWRVDVSRDGCRNPKVAARLGRRQERERAKEAARTKDEDDAVEAAGAAAAAKANLGGHAGPDGVGVSARRLRRDGRRQEGEEG